MKREPHDPILDACLEEILGGHTPPDLSDSIMEHWQKLESVASPGDTVPGLLETSTVVSPPVTASLPTKGSLDLPVQQAVTSGSPTNDQLQTPVPIPQTHALRRASSWSRTATLLSILTIGACLGLIAIKVFPPQQPVTPGNAVADNAGETLPAPANSSTDSQQAAREPSSVATPGTTRPTTHEDRQASVTPGNPRGQFGNPKAVA
ncbi:MAG: hypothetical protein ABGX05_12280, partial [Pirellulaceae bacterium]